jgi:coenzyme F420 hydrogenase subunit beta
MLIEPRACQKIESEVIDRGLCTLCGACVSICPYFVAYNGRVLARDICDLPEGRCTDYCPRVSLDLDALNRAVFHTPYDWTEMGTMLAVLMARPADRKARERAQDAGTVSTLMRFALDEGIIDSAVVTFFEDKKFPEARTVSDGEALLLSSGSSYMATPVLEAFNLAVREPDRKRVGLVATPCQTLALAKMRTSESEKQKGIDKLSLAIGLFCTWALSYPAFGEFLEQEIHEPIMKYKIPPPPANVLQVFTSKGETDLPLERIMPFVRPGCAMCHDMTSEFADISVGAVEFADTPVGTGRKEGSSWNTVIIRTESGMRLLDAARSKGIIETDRLPSQILTHLKTAARNKKKRAIQNIIQRTRSREDLLFLKADPSKTGTLLDE